MEATKRGLKNFHIDVDLSMALERGIERGRWSDLVNEAIREKLVKLGILDKSVPKNFKSKEYK